MWNERPRECSLPGNFMPMKVRASSRKTEIFPSMLGWEKGFNAILSSGNPVSKVDAPNDEERATRLVYRDIIQDCLIATFPLAVPSPSITANSTCHLLLAVYVNERILCTNIRYIKQIKSYFQSAWEEEKIAMKITKQQLLL